jgi:hypothetical protein
VFRETFTRNDIRLGFRPHYGDQRGQLQWRPACRGTIRQILRNPVYAGAYVYGRFPVDPKKKLTGRVARQRWEADPERWQVLIKDRLPAYITWDQFETNCRQLKTNYAYLRSRLGAPRNGTALLGGVMRCAKCGGRMSATYGGRQHGFRYSCDHFGLKDRGKCCQALAGPVVDELVVQQVFKVLEPAALKLSCQAAEAIQQERDRLHRHWKQRLTRAHYESQLAQRRYEAVDPANRLVAGTLESQWEETLKDLEDAEAAHAEFLQQQPEALAQEQKETIFALASDIPSLWHAPTTLPADRQAILRLLIEQVTVETQGVSERFEVAVRWRGGYESRHSGIRPIHRFQQLHDYDHLLARAIELRRLRYSSRSIAKTLNEEGFRSPCQDRALTDDSVYRLLNGHRGSAHPRWCMSFANQLAKDEIWLRDLAMQLDMLPATLHTWVYRGWVLARKVATAGGMLAIQANEAELERLRALCDHSRQFPHRSPPAILKTPCTQGN